MREGAADEEPHQNRADHPRQTDPFGELRSKGRDENEQTDLEQDRHRGIVYQTPYREHPAPGSSILALSLGSRPAGDPKQTLPS